MTELKRTLAISLRVASVISIAMISLAASVFFWKSSGFVIPGGSAMFFRWSQNLLGIMPPDVAQRDIGFPLLIWLSGFTLTGSLTGITLIYAFFGFLMPLLAYWTIRPFSPWVAWLTAIGIIVSCGPWLFFRFYYPDQACIFFSTLSLVCLTTYLVRGTTAWLVAFTAASLFLSITRPAMNAVFPVLMLVAIVFAPTEPKTRQNAPTKDRHTHKDRIGNSKVHWFSILACIAAFGIGIILYHTYRDRAFNVAKLGYTPSYTGEQIFYNAYINSGEFGLVLGPSIGPAMQKVDEGLRKSLQPSPRESEFLKPILDQNTPDFAAQNFFFPTTDALVDRIWVAPNYEYAMLIDGAVPDAVLLDAAQEIAYAHPLYIARYVARNLWHFLFSPGWAHTRGNTAGYVYTGLNFYPAGIDLHEIDLLPPRAVAEANEPPAYPEVMADLAWYWRWFIYWPFIWGTSFFMVAGWIAIASAPFLYSRPFVGSYLAASGLFLYNAVIVSAFADPDFRYQAMVLVLRATTAAFGLIATWPKQSKQA